MKKNLKRVTSLLLSLNVLCGAALFSGCDSTDERKPSGIVQIDNSTDTSDGTSSTSDYTSSQLPEPEPEPIEIPEGIIPIRSLSEALENFSEIESREARDGDPEEIVQTLLERNILCFAALQGKCWTYDEKYSENYEFSHGIVPIQSDYLTSLEQIDDLFYSTYTISKTNFLIHYDDGEYVEDAFIYDYDGLNADFSQVLKNAMDSFETPTYAAVVSVDDEEIIFERYYEPSTDEGTPQPNNYRFSAVRRDNGEWVLEEYIIDVPAYKPMYTHLLQTGRRGNPDIEKIAMSEVGYFGGLKYSFWSGYDFRIEWCAAFVSWCFYEAGADGPFFIAVNSEGIPWFEERGRFVGADYRDIAPGDCIFMDWEDDGWANHVGLVIGTDGEKVYTIEGNRSDACQQFAYDLDDPRIFGYGLMNWD